MNPSLEEIMAKHKKHNETPVAPFNLRVTGPMRPEDVKMRLGKGYRLAHEHGDRNATVDADPCPHCNAPVEWAGTTTTELGKVVTYVYGRCQGKTQHGWGFSNKATKRDYSHMVVDTTPVPRPSAGTAAMAMWIDKQAEDLQKKLLALEELKRLATFVALGGRSPGPLASPRLPVPPNGDPTPPAR